jgi:hypothetical protein
MCEVVIGPRQTGDLSSYGRFHFLYDFSYFESFILFFSKSAYALLIISENVFPLNCLRSFVCKLMVVISDASLNERPTVCFSKIFLSLVLARMIQKNC